MRMTMRTMMKMKTMSRRAAALALPPRGTPQTLTPTETQPHLGPSSPTDRLCFSPCSVPCPPPLFSFFLSFLNKIWCGGGAGGAQARTLQPQRHQPWGPPASATIRLSRHWTGPSPHPSALAVPAWTVDLGVGGSPKEFSEALYPCSPTSPGVEAWGRTPPFPEGLAAWTPAWNWRQGTWGEEGRCLRENRHCPVALSPAPCRKELPGPTHGGRGRGVFYICVYIFFLSSELSTRRFLPISAAVSVVISGRGRV